jgi:hypothetical protein
VDTVGFYLVGDSTKPTFKIPIGLTQPVATETKVNITVTSPSGAANGTEFTLSETVVTIPAGQALTSVTLTANNATYLAGRVDTVVVKISGPGITGDFNQTFNLTIKSFFCPVVLTDLAGNYTKTFEGTYGPYTTKVLNLVSTGPTSASGEINNIWDFASSGFPNVTVPAEFDWSDPYNYSVTIPESATGLALSGGRTLYMRTTPGSVSKFSSCDNTITLKIDIYYYDPSTGDITYYSGTNDYEVKMGK